MANRRMFAKTIVQTGKFLMLPVSVRELYFQCGMSADDDGFFEIIPVMRICNASEHDMKILVENGYVNLHESYVGHVVHWLESNEIRSDRYNPSSYIHLLPSKLKRPKARLKSGSTSGTTTGRTQVRLGKVRLGKVNNNIYAESQNDSTFSFQDFIFLFNQITGKKFKGDKKSKAQFNARVRDDQATREQFEHVITLAKLKLKGTDYEHNLTPELVTRIDKFQKYANVPGKYEDTTEDLVKQRDKLLAENPANADEIEQQFEKLFTKSKGVAK